MILLRNVVVYSPHPIGIRDILIVADKIAAIDERLTVNLPHLKTIDCTSKIAVPGFIDNHVHLLGGGGEGGFRTRTPELSFSELVRSGTTTVVGCLGTDGVTRSLESLYAKAKALEEEGVSSYIYVGSYRVPPVTFTGSIIKDLVLIDKVIGVGEIAISDHRSSQPTMDELKRLVSDARVGGMLSGKAGLVNVHVGDGSAMLEPLFHLIETTEIPVTQFLPTHINRNLKLLAESAKWLAIGGTIDLTTSVSDLLEKRLQPWYIFSELLKEGFENQITFSSDGQGSLPRFDEGGSFVGLDVGKVRTLYEQMVLAVKNGVSLEKALLPVTQNVARMLKLNRKGLISEGMDGDIVLLDQDFNIDTVIAKGKVLMLNKQQLVKGTFEI
ncbi:beta-aspartyl-peptidase [Pseudothermotoga sp.]|nr:beta-aspartyl-peptidase [Pseudothermotoga sp.]MCX7812778.1 beta-aspartyl-peptidase [Pseudothermotoga sp.]MDW8139058.1 beta-aspartyl-peptidase [Pseudothermotoga sp.]